MFDLVAFCTIETGNSNIYPNKIENILKFYWQHREQTNGKGDAN